MFLVPIQSHANIDLVTFDSLNSHTIQKLIQERDRLEFGNMRQRHTLLHQIDRTPWPVLFQILKLHEKLPSTYVFENKKYFKRFKRLLVEDEDEVLEVLKKQFPQQEASNMVDLCSKVTWCIDPRYSTYLNQYVLKNHAPSSLRREMPVITHYTSLIPPYCYCYSLLLHMYP